MDSIFHASTAFFQHWGSAFWLNLRETAPFLMFGLVMAGMLHVLVPAKLVLWALGHGGFRGAIRGAVIGMPLPLCSCSVIPTALTLRRQGASLSASTAFSISTPETSIDALAITAALLPTVYFGVRPLAALLLAIGVGVIVEAFSVSRRDDLRVNVMKLARAIEKDLEPSSATSVSQSAEDAQIARNASEICRICGLMSSAEHKHGTWARTRAIFDYAFGTFFRDIASLLIFGLLIAAAIQVLTPSDLFREGWLNRHQYVQVFLAILIGVPLYSCATATTPLVAVLLTKGLDPGAALALLLAGPATNIGNVFALKRELGKRITTVYYISLIGLCWALGVMFSYFWPVVAKYPSLTQVGSFGGSDWSTHLIPGWFEIACSWILILLTLKVWGQNIFAQKHHHNHDHDHEHDHHHKDESKSCC